MKSLVAISAAVALRVGENDHLHNGKKQTTTKYER